MALTALVTGSSGFIGTHLVRTLRDIGWAVFELDLKHGQDIADAPLPPVDRVFHLAAQTNARCTDVAADARINIMGLLRVLDAYQDRVVFASSSMVNYPSTPYAISKHAGEMYAKMRGAAIVRLCNIHGPGGHGVHQIFETADVMEIRGRGDQLRTYAPVHDAVDQLMNSEPGNLDVVSGTDMTVNDVADLFNKPRRYVPGDASDIVDGRQVYR